ncbi:MAG: MOSC N-terminal beta barrel domain-containing protein, partial [Allorhizobium sp.]
MQVTGLFIYPFKSARGIAVPQAPIDAMGLSGDRRMMLVDPSGHFITQRELPALARLIALPAAAYLTLRLDDGREMMVAPPQPDNRMEVAIWQSPVSAAVAHESVNDTLSEWFGRPVKLVFIDGDSHREASADWAGEGSPMGFAD